MEKICKYKIDLKQDKFDPILGTMMESLNAYYCKYYNEYNKNCKNCKQLEEENKNVIQEKN